MSVAHKTDNNSSTLLFFLPQQRQQQQKANRKGIAFARIGVQLKMNRISIPHRTEILTIQFEFTAIIFQPKTNNSDKIEPYN